MDHTYSNSPYNTPIYNHYYWEPQLPPSIHIHPQSAAGQLGYTPEELAPILREQQQFLQNELAQPPCVLTMVPFTWSPPNMYTQNRNANFGPFPYPSDRNDPFDSKNKTIGQIFDWVKIEEVITSRPVQISPLGT